MSDTIDLKALRKLKTIIGGDAEDLAELVDEFNQSLPEQVADMRAQTAQSDWASLRITAHSCKSNARDLGVSALADLCAALESQCKEGMPTDVEAQLSEIAIVADNALTAFRGLNLHEV